MAILRGRGDPFMERDLLRRLAQVLNTVSVDESWSEHGGQLMRVTLLHPDNATDLLSFDEAEAELGARETDLAQKLIAISRYFELKD